MTDGDAPTSQSVTQGGTPPDPILIVLERTQQYLLDIAAVSANKPMTIDRRKTLDRQLKDLEDLVRYNTRITQLTKEYRALSQGQEIVWERYRIILPSRRSMEDNNLDPPNSNNFNLSNSSSSNSNNKTLSSSSIDIRYYIVRLRVKISEIIKLLIYSNLY